jgi:hypothetical protein
MMRGIKTDHMEHTHKLSLLVCCTLFVTQSAYVFCHRIWPSWGSCELHRCVQHMLQAVISKCRCWCVCVYAILILWCQSVIRYNVKTVLKLQYKYATSEYAVVYTQSVLALGSLDPNWLKDYIAHHRSLHAAHYATLTSYRYCDFNTVLTLYLTVDLHHNINIVYRQTALCTLLPNMYDCLHYMFYTSVKFVASWRWQYFVAETCGNNE